MNVKKIGDPVGAEVTGVNLTEALSASTMAEIESALTAHSVIVFRDQHLTPEHQLTFARRFGELEINAFDKHALAEHAGILKVSNIREGEIEQGYADAGSFWHSDMSYTQTPPRLTMLYALEIPNRDGRTLGNTLFASALDAYEALSDELKEELDGLKAVHSFSAKKRGVNKPVELSPDQIRQNPPVTHPVARTHPVSGRKALYVTADECIGIVGWPDADAEALITKLAKHVVEPRFQYRHIWQVGDLLIWDNCAVQHVVDRDYQFPPDRRMLHRCTVNGSAPY